VRATNSATPLPGEQCGRSWEGLEQEGIVPFGSSGPGPNPSLNMSGQFMLLNTVLIIVAILLMVLGLWGWPGSQQRGVATLGAKWLPWRGDHMPFELAQTQYDNKTKRAYVELKRGDDDGGEQLVVAVFTFRTNERFTRHRLRRSLSARPVIF
jgi:hypothetical protein